MSVAFSPDGRTALSGSRDRWCVWSAGVCSARAMPARTQMLRLVCSQPTAELVLDGSVA
jgi:hypothetical protein